MNATKFNTIDECIASQMPVVQPILVEMRQIIRQAIPEATEVISWGMPAFKLKSTLVFFAAYKNHLGYYPTSSGIKVFEEEFKKRNYAYSKGAVQFPLDQPLPKELIQKIALFRLEEDKGKKKK